MGSQLSMRTAIQLNNGRDMPLLGLGVARMAEGAETEQSVLWALEAGYRLIDTAKIYGNEASVGRAVRKSGIAREEIFVTTKLWPSDFFRVRAALQKSLDKLGLAYIDLYLIHWPIPLIRSGIWKDFEKIYAAGLVRSIGVSNYSVKQLAALATADIPPAVNQVLFHPFSYKKELLDYCKSKNIALEAYSPLARGKIERSGDRRDRRKICEDAGSNHDPVVSAARPHRDTEIQQQTNEFSRIPRFSIFTSKTMI